MERLRFPVAAVLAAMVTLSIFLLMHQLVLSGTAERTELDLTKRIHFGPVNLADDIALKNRIKPRKPPPIDSPPTPPKMQVPKVQNQALLIPQVDIPRLDLPLIRGSGMFLGNFLQVDTTAEGDIIPVVVIRPIYPREAALEGIQGWVKLEFTITELGLVKDPRVIDASPAHIFNREAIRAILKWRFKPRVIDGVAVERRATQLIEFSLDASGGS